MIKLDNLKSKKTIQELLEFSIINIDKPSGPTSFQVSQYVKDSLGLSKTSHMGTLDPQVTGVLPITLGRACKLSDYFMHKNKEYAGIMRLHNGVSKEELEKIIKKFIGKITQLPPVRSRVKRAVREREIISFEILEVEGKEVLFKTEVQAGTYIRKLCDDIGKQIGGAHMLELRRTKAGIFTENNHNFINLYDLEKAVNEYKKGNSELLNKILLPAEEAIKKVLPVIQIEEKNIRQVLTGKPLIKQDIKNIPIEEKFAAFMKEKFIGIYHSVKEGDLIARAEFVFN